ncbi:MAG: MmgE/PrpD family protein [Omnitrophica WOR_2 bacterium]
MTMVQQMADFVAHARYEDLSETACQALKIHILDALGCALGALDGEPIRLIRQQLDDFGGSPLCSLIAGGKTSPDRAAFYNSALVRYLDFNDSYLAKGETCHPSDNLGAVLAASEYSQASGKDLMTSLAVAYQVQCHLSDVAPVRNKGFDHTTQGAYAVASGVSRALHLDPVRTANAIAISGTAYNALRVTRTGPLSNWKGLAYPDTVFGATHAAFLAMRGITGPLDVFEGNKGFMESITGPFQVDWSHEDLEKVTGTVIKKYNAEMHSQSALEGILELKQVHPFQADQVDHIDIDIFDVAYHIIGGGEEGNKKTIQNKEQADHSLPYMIAVAILDGKVTPEQYLPDRIRRNDVQELLQRVDIHPSKEYSQKFPFEMDCKITVSLKNGSSFTQFKTDYEGFFTRPITWEHIIQKFQVLSSSSCPPQLQDELIDAVAHLEEITTSDLLDLLARAMIPGDSKV